MEPNETRGTVQNTVTPDSPAGWARNEGDAQTPEQKAIVDSLQKIENERKEEETKTEQEMKAAAERLSKPPEERPIFAPTKIFIQYGYVQKNKRFDTHYSTVASSVTIQQVKEAVEKLTGITTNTPV